MSPPTREGNEEAGLLPPPIWLPERGARLVSWRSWPGLIGSVLSCVFRPALGRRSPDGSLWGETMPPISAPDAFGKVEESMVGPMRLGRELLEMSFPVRARCDASCGRNSC